MDRSKVIFPLPPTRAAVLTFQIAGTGGGMGPVAPPSMFDANGRRVVIVSGTVSDKQTKKPLRDVSSTLLVHTASKSAPCSPLPTLGLCDDRRRTEHH